MACYKLSELVNQYGANWYSQVTINGGPYSTMLYCEQNCQCPQNSCCYGIDVELWMNPDDHSEGTFIAPRNLIRYVDCPNCNCTGVSEEEFDALCIALGKPTSGEITAAILAVYGSSYTGNYYPYPPADDIDTFRSNYCPGQGDIQYVLL